MSALQVRFHLGQGQHYRHWQIKDLATGEIKYIDPKSNTLLMTNAKLVNKKGTAQKIFSGAQKYRSVCGWLELKAEHLTVMASSFVDMDVFTQDFKQVSYDPKKRPYWVSHRSGANLDGVTIGWMCSHGRKLYTSDNRI